MPRLRLEQVADAEPGRAEVVAAATAFALPGLPAECQIREALAAEHRRSHADVAWVIAVLPFPGHFSGTIRAECGEAAHPSESLDQPSHTAPTEHDVVVQKHHPRGCSPRFPLVPSPRDRFIAIRVLRPRRAL